MLGIERVEQLLVIAGTDQAVVELVPEGTDPLVLETQCLLQRFPTVHGQVFPALPDDQATQRTHARLEVHPVSNQQDDRDDEQGSHDQPEHSAQGFGTALLQQCEVGQ
ncbi:hypothetical protein D9M68_780240 [compost metagenome]